MQALPLFLVSGYEQTAVKTSLSQTIQIHTQVNPFSDEGLRSILKKANQSSHSYFLLFLKPGIPQFTPHALERLIQVADDTGAGLLYTDYAIDSEGGRTVYTLNDYQTGSIRDDFDFGALLLVRTKFANTSLPDLSQPLKQAAWYELRLAISRQAPIIHLNEQLYSLTEHVNDKNEASQFAYVDPKNSAVQAEMEHVFTKHLQAIGAWLPPVFKPVNLAEGTFPVEVSVIIPVRNRSKTIADAMYSVLSQQADFPYNLIVIDNHSTDGTTAIVSKFAEGDKRIIHLIPQRNDLGIGGCWNEGIHHEGCGRFAVQLDSDDVYSSPDTLNRVVKAFYDQQCAMLVGSYRMCNFNLETIPPGIIDHKEWTEENGRNNALRVNGLGAPRAFYTPLLRAINVPNTSYGEDYALGLRFSRTWKIGRIYEVLYLCRRWEDNSDASPNQAKLNGFNAYKDKLRTFELAARQQLNQLKSSVI